jgi:hypothetical protein
MKISGFTIVRNAIKYDYPVLEAISSVLPLCDEFIIMLGNSDDGTEEMLNSVKNTGGVLNSVKIIPSTWDDSLRVGGKVLAVETDKAFANVAPDSDWAFYIQADEVIHEKYLPAIKHAMQTHLHNKKVECLVLKYLHFYGSYDYVGDTRQWYRREARIIRNDKSISAYRDAQGFRRNGKKLHGALVDAYVYHYGWVRQPAKQQRKCEDVARLWHSDEEIKRIVVQANEYDYSQIKSLARFTGGHPKVMQQRLLSMDWDFRYDPCKRKISLKEKILAFIERITGKRLWEFTNYKLAA